MSYETYLVLHVTGILLTFVALGGAALHSLNGGTRESNRGRGLVAGLHGTGLVLVFVAGFGLLARTGLADPSSWPLWVLVKLVVWLLLGGAIAVLNRAVGSGRWLFIALPVLGAVAAAMAIVKPGSAVAPATEPPAVVAPATGSGATP